MDNTSENIFLSLIKLGKKDEAIRLYSVEKKCSIEDAKIFIEEIERVSTIDGYSHNDNQDLLEVINRGEKINAIKIYRDRTRCSLKEAKDFIEGLEKGVLPKNSNSLNLSLNSDNSDKRYSQKPLMTGRTKFEGCFIATVCYNGYDSPEVIKFRKYRDEVLSGIFLGKLIINLYYIFSPGFSRMLNKSNFLKHFIRIHILDRLLKRIQ